MKKYNLSSKMILNKKFETELSGYNPKEVDEFLDLIISDFNAFKEEIEILEKKLIEKAAFVSDKEEEIEKLNIELQNLKSQLKESQKASQYEILKAIDDLKKKN